MRSKILSLAVVVFFYLGCLVQAEQFDFSIDRADVVDLVVSGSPWVDVRAFGEATAATIQAAVNYAVSGSTVFIPSTGGPYTFSDNVTISKPLTLLSDGGVVNVAAGKKGFVIASDNVTINGLVIRGAQSLANVDEERGIHAQAASGSDPYSNIKILNNRILRFGGYGIYARYIKDFDISSNTVSDINYGAIVGLSVVDGVITRNIVDNVHATVDGYGIELTRQESNSLVTDPQSADVVVSNNTVRNNPAWKCYGSHGGVRLSFIGNSGHNCAMGIAVGAADNASNDQAWAPQEIVISGNTLSSGVTDGSAQSGISFTGAYEGSAPVDNATGSITGNIVKGFGAAGSSRGSGVYLHSTNGVVVSGNVILEPAVTGIHLANNNYGFAIVGNTIKDVWSDNASNTTWGIRAESDYQYGSISGNSLVRGAKSAAYVNQYGIRIDTGNANESVAIGENNFNTSTADISDGGSVGHGYFLSASTTYDPPVLGVAVDNNYVTTVVTVQGAGVSDIAWCSHDNTPVGVTISGAVSTANNVRCTFLNKTGAPANIISGTLRAVVRKN